MLNKQYYVEKAKVDRLVARKNTKADFYNGIYDRYEYPVPVSYTHLTLPTKLEV